MIHTLRSQGGFFDCVNLIQAHANHKKTKTNIQVVLLHIVCKTSATVEKKKPECVLP